jgi:hypothetical protein
LGSRYNNEKEGIKMMYPIPKDKVEYIEREKKKFEKEIHVRNIPKEKFFKKYVKIRVVIPNEIKKFNK